VDAHGMPVRILITEGTRPDCKETECLIDGITAQALLADKAYDVDALIQRLLQQNTQVVIPPKKNRKHQRTYDQYLYRLRHLIENAFLHLKQGRGIATRYAKNSKSFLAAVQMRCILLWAKIS
jgi:transposase